MDRLEQLANEFVEQVRANIEANGQKASGRTGNALRVVMKPDGAGFEIWGATYTGVLETGRKPGKVPYNFSDILIEWARYKGITFASPADAKRWAYFVGKRIREEGTKLYREGGHSGTIVPDLEKLEDEIRKIVVAEIKNNFFEL